jgi:outer membrane biosynthesis protein TonB
MRKDPVKAAILFTVLAAHCFFLFYMHAFFTPETKRPHKPLIVKTMAAAATPKEKIAAAPTAQGSSARKPVNPKPKESPPPKPAPKKPQPTATPPPAKKAPPIADKKLVKEKKPQPKKPPVDDKREKMSQKLLQELEESLSKIEAKPEKKKGSSKKYDLPSPIEAQKNQAFPSASTGEISDSSDYHATLIGYLKQTLNLPEYGEVKIQLTLKQDGSVVNLLVIKTESEKNRRYLETSLPHLRFPHLLENKKQETFIVTFCNEI